MKMISDLERVKNKISYQQRVTVLCELWPTGMLAKDIGRKIGLTSHEVGVLRYKLKLPQRHSFYKTYEAHREAIREERRQRRERRAQAKNDWIARINQKYAEKIAAREARRREREIRLAERPIKKRVDASLVRALFDDGASVSDLCKYFGLGAVTVKKKLKEAK